MVDKIERKKSEVTKTRGKSKNYKLNQGMTVNKRQIVGFNDEKEMMGKIGNRKK